MPLEGFEAFPFTHAGATRDVYRRGSGPGVVVIHEIPGITPERFAAIATDAKQNCPVSKALAGVEITLEAALV